ncbi:chemotaxis protein CheA, partial [Bradyrhizobium sp. NAS96.2]|uniref:chemotaxis protein CheA n=1 Tax=Bradyrhizobium sp. NAS96.2 TaxID=1680160 RepID=UPI0009674222
DVQEGDKIANQSIRVNVDTLEHLMTMVSELVLTRNQLLEISRRNEDTEFKVPLQRLSNVTAELQEGVMKTRMQPIGNAWQKLPRIVRDLSGELGKQIELEMHGADTELDRQVLDLIKDPLTHMVRNSADHGLETTAERLAAGKGEQGTIRLSAYHEGGHIIICIADNGRGLNTERIKAKALQNGLVTEAELEKMTEAQIHKFIFAPGFSTAAQVTSVSGRGVGMDVVRTNIDQIGGTIDIKSVAGEGASVTIKIPLTLAIVSALIVEAGGDRFAIPQLSVVELVRARANSEHRIERIKDTAVLRLRNKLLPLIHLKKLLRIDDGATTSDAENGFIVVTQVGSQTFGIVVDGVFHTEEIVVKPMSTKLRHID